MDAIALCAQYTRQIVFEPVPERLQVADDLLPAVFGPQAIVGRDKDGIVLQSEFQDP